MNMRFSSHGAGGEQYLMRWWGSFEFDRARQDFDCSRRVCSLPFIHFMEFIFKIQISASCDCVRTPLMQSRLGVKSIAIDQSFGRGWSRHDLCFARTHRLNKIRQTAWPMLLIHCCIYWVSVPIRRAALGPTKWMDASAKIYRWNINRSTNNK